MKLCILLLSLGLAGCCGLVRYDVRGFSAVADGESVEGVWIYLDIVGAESTFDACPIYSSWSEQKPYIAEVKASDYSGKFERLELTQLILEEGGQSFRAVRPEEPVVGRFVARSSMKTHDRQRFAKCYVEVNEWVLPRLGSSILLRGELSLVGDEGVQKVSVQGVLKPYEMRGTDWFSGIWDL